MRQEPEFFGEQEMDLVFVARKLRHAVALEEALTKAGIDYAVEIDEYMAGIIFKTTRQGAFFYVLPDQLEAARKVTLETGLTPFERD
jgi:hypothetical protein